MQQAHHQGVLHRDIKPGNLMLDAEGKLYVTDFGLARIVADAGMTMTGDVVGTLRYMAPEQALAKRVVIDHRADVYSLGVTLYEMLTLEPAFSGDDRQELLSKIAFAEPRPPRRIDATISADLETIVLKAVAKDPEERYASAQELADDLARFLEHKVIRAKPPTVMERVAKWSRRHQAAVWSMAITLVAISVALSSSFVVIDGTKRRRAKAKGDLEVAYRREADAAVTARAAERQSGDLLFAADVRLAGEALASHNISEARERLSRHIPVGDGVDRRGFAWHYLWRQLSQEEMTFVGHGPSFDVEYSPDGELIASSHESGAVILRRTSSAGEPKILHGCREIVRKIDFSPDGKLLGAVSDGGEIFVWDLDSARIL
ncbi:MAG: WD40 repeat domain-containing serine/threonine protein kinase, partial [Planctomycetota bacterium]